MVKGNLVVGQGGGPTVVINNSLVGVIQEALERDAIVPAGCVGQIEGIWGMVHGIEGFLHDQMIDLRRQSPAVLEGL